MCIISSIESVFTLAFSVGKKSKLDGADSTALFLVARESNQVSAAKGDRCLLFSVDTFAELEAAYLIHSAIFTQNTFHLHHYF